MELKAYNTLQTEIFKKYNINKLVLKNIILFNKVCSFLSYIRHYNNIKDAKNIACMIVEEVLKMTSQKKLYELKHKMQLLNFKYFNFADKIYNTENTQIHIF